MATKKYNHEYFTATVGGQEIEFHCWTTSNRNGFCHYCYTEQYGNSRCVYCNRTWERFRYETVLERMIEKFPKDMQSELREQLIEDKFKAVEKECDEKFDRFKSLYDGLNEENKERMKSFPHMNSESDVNLAMGFMGLLTLMQE